MHCILTRESPMSETEFYGLTLHYNMEKISFLLHDYTYHNLTTQYLDNIMF